MKDGNGEHVLTHRDVPDNWVDGDRFSQEMWEACGRTNMESSQYFRQESMVERYRIDFRNKGIFALNTFTHEEFASLISVALVNFVAYSDRDEVDGGMYEKIYFIAAIDEEDDFGNGNIEGE